MADVRYKDHTALTGGLAAGDVFPIDELVSGSTYQTRRATAAMVATYVEAGLTAIYQPLDADLMAIAALSATNDDLIQRKAGAWTNRTIAQVKTDFGLAVIATSGSASDLIAGTVPLARLAGITTAELSATAGITNGQLAGSIAYGKLTLTDSIVNADINSAAAIAYSKLNLSGAILNADLAGSIANAKLANSSVTIGSTSVSLGATAATIAGLTLTAPTVNGGAATALTALGIRSTGAAFDLTIASAEVFTAGRILTIAMGDAARTLTFGGDATLNGGTHSGTNTGDQTITLSGDVSGSGTGAITAAIGATKVTSAMLNSDVYSTAHSWGGQQTFTAPILGTPATGTLTNCTGLPPTTGIVGWPANASGVLTNDGAGVLSWGAGGGASGANPTASVGLTAVNGVATTFLRSDGAPALDQGIAPTWTGIHTFNNGVTTGGGATSGTVFSYNSLTTGVGANISSSSVTSGSIVNIASTSTAGATGVEGLNIAMSGANGTAAQTITGGRISVTNTNATSGTNVALELTASGASTLNTALNVTAGQIITPNGTSTLPAIGLGGVASGLWFDASWGPSLIAGAVKIWATNGTYGFLLPSTMSISWTPDNLLSLPDLRLFRAAASVLRVSNGTTGAGSLVLGTSTVGSIGTSGVGVLAIANGTAPTSRPADEGQLFAKDIAAGDSRFFMLTESGSLATVIGNNAVGCEPAAGTDIAGASFTLFGGQATGNALPGAVRLQTSVVGSTGSTVQSLVDRIICPGGRKTLTDAAATSLFEIALPTLKGASVYVTIGIFAGDGADAQQLSQRVRITSINKGGTYTTSATVVDEASALSSGTLTATWSISNGTDKITAQVTADSSLTTTSLYAIYQIENESDQAITRL